MLEQEAKAKETNDTLSKKNVSIIPEIVTFIIEEDDHSGCEQQSDPEQVLASSGQ